MPEEIAALRERLRQQVMIPLLVLPAIHVLMLLLPYGGGALIRLAATVVYFAMLLTALWFVRAELADYVERLETWRYRHANPVLQEALKLYLLSMRAVVGRMSLVLGVFVAAAALHVLRAWPLFFILRPLAPLIDAVFWLSALAVPAALIFNDGSIATMLNRRRFLIEETAMREPGLRDQGLGGRTEAAGDSDLAAVRVLGDHSFAAGGSEWSWAELRQNMVIFGTIGSGKTVCVLNAMIDGLLTSSASSAHRPAVLLLDAKGEYGEDDCRKMRTLCRRIGRETDLVVIDPADLQGSARWNPFDNADDAFENASRVAAVMEMLGGGQGADDAFWVESCKTFVQHAIALLRVTNADGEPANFRQIMRLAGDQDEIRQRAALISPDDMMALADTIDYFVDTWMELDPKTGSAIQAYLRNMMGPFLGAPYTTVFAGRSTVTLERVLDEGLILYVHMPTAQREAMARIISTFIKLEMQREVRRRRNKPRYSLFFCDEFQQFVTAGRQASDAAFFAVSRESNHVNIVATQSLQTLLEKVPRRELVMSVLGNCGVKLFLRNTEVDTNDYASKLFGEVLMRTSQESRNVSSRLGEIGRGSGGHSGSSKFEAKVRPEAFGALGVPRPGAGAESIVHLSNQREAGERRLVWPVHPL